MICIIEDCDVDAVGRGLCMKHYRRWKRGRLDVESYQRPTGSAAMNVEWPFEFMKDGDVWLRRPVGSKGDWEVVPGFKSLTRRGDGYVYA